MKYSSDVMEYVDYELHEESFDLPKYKYRALCTSEACTTPKGKKKTHRVDPGVEKKVSKNKENCPDCGDYLFWERSIA